MSSLFVFLIRLVAAPFARAISHRFVALDASHTARMLVCMFAGLLR